MKCCENCDYYAEPKGVCCNADSEYCADWPPEPEEYFCDEWKEKDDA